MRVVRAERWHFVRGGAAAAAGCSVCGSGRLGTLGETVIDGETAARYRVVRCQDCGYDLLTAPDHALAAAS